MDTSRRSGAKQPANKSEIFADLTSSDDRPQAHHHARKLQAIIPANQTEPEFSSQPITNQSLPSASNSTGTPALPDVTATPLHFNEKIYYFREPTFYQRFSLLQIILTVLVLLNLVALLTMSLLLKLTQRQVDAKLNELIVDMMIEENSNSDLFKFYIYGNYRFIDVKIESLDEPRQADRATLVLTHCDPYIDDNRGAGPKRVPGTSKGYQELAGGKDGEEHRPIIFEDKENLNFVNKAH